MRPASEIQAPDPRAAIIRESVRAKKSFQKNQDLKESRALQGRYIDAVISSLETGEPFEERVSPELLLKFFSRLRIKFGFDTVEYGPTVARLASVKKILSAGFLTEPYQFIYWIVSNWGALRKDMRSVFFAPMPAPEPFLLFSMEKCRWLHSLWSDEETRFRIERDSVFAERERIISERGEQR